MSCTRPTRSIGVVLVAGLAFAPLPEARGQLRPPPRVPNTPNAASAADAPQPVVLKRERVELTSPDAYRVSLFLEPGRTVDLVAPSDGYLRSVLAEPGEVVSLQKEIARMQDDELQLEVQRAVALETVAQLELEMAGDGTAAAGSDMGTPAQRLATARLEAARAATAIAKLRAERTSIRAPIDGRVFEVHAAEGRFLQAGEPIATIGTTDRLRAEIPLSRADAKVGEEIELAVGDETVKATIDHVRPLAPRFDRLRDIVADVVSVVVVIDNSGGENEVGQTVHSPLVPTRPIAIVANSAIGNTPDGGRRIQVLREETIRDIPVRVLAGIGAETSYVSGPLQPTDELIVHTPVELVDGQKVRSAPDTTTAGSPVRPVRRRSDDD